MTPARPVVVALPAGIDLSNARQVRQQLCSALAPGVLRVLGILKLDALLHIYPGPDNALPRP